jgi:hypothetical protein
MGGIRQRVRPRKAGKKAFIAGALVDIWAIVVLVIVIVIFWFIYKAGAEARIQHLQDKKDIVYGNYLAQVYLRTPLLVAGEPMTVAELIAMYDYNQTLERAQEDREDFAEAFVNEPRRFFAGTDNPMREAIIQITDDFVDANFDEKKCFMFSIHGNSFDYNRGSEACPGARGFGMHYLFSQMPWVPNATYVTYLSPIDPRAKPISVYSVYDFERLLSIYAPDKYFDMDEARRVAIAFMCNSDPLSAAFNDNCREGAVS